MQDSKFWKKDPSYCVQIVNYVAPDEENYMMQSHFVTGKSQITPVSDILDDEKKGGVVMKLLRNKNNQ